MVRLLINIDLLNEITEDFEKMEPINFSDVAENDKMRSRYFFENIIRDNSCENIDSATTSQIPKRVIQYWDDKDIPNDVQMVMNTWEESGLDIIIFNKFTAEKFMDECGNIKQTRAFDLCTHPAMRADYFRLCYLYERGGFYVDADDNYKGIDLTSLFRDDNLKVQPLCYDIESDNMIDPSILFESTEFNQNYIYYVNNDPIIVRPKHPLIELALNRATNNLLEKKKNLKDIQSIAGPGNLSASVVQYSLNCQKDSLVFDVELLKNWDDFSTPQWNLNYRKDQRNWRNWKGTTM